MRFQNSSNVQFPQTSALNPTAFQFDGVSLQSVDPRSGTKRASIHSPAGATAVIIPGSRRLRIYLKQLVISWAGVTVVGHFEIRTHAIDPIFLYQSLNAGQVVMPCFDEEMFLGRYGLRVQNNSIGGDYAINAYYDILET